MSNFHKKGNNKTIIFNCTLISFCVFIIIICLKQLELMYLFFYNSILYVLMFYCVPTS